MKYLNLLYSQKKIEGLNILAKVFSSPFFCMNIHVISFIILRYQYSYVNDNDKGVCNSDDFITPQISRWQVWPWYTCCPRFQKGVDPPHRHPRDPRAIIVMGKEMVREGYRKLLQCWNLERECIPIFVTWTII